MISGPNFANENNKTELYDALKYFIFRPLSSIESETIQCDPMNTFTTDPKIYPHKIKVSNSLLQISDFFIGSLIRCLMYFIITMMIPVTLINFFAYYLHTICRNTILMLYGSSSKQSHVAMTDLKTHKMIGMNILCKIKHVMCIIFKIIYDPIRKNTTRTNTSIQNLLLFIMIFAQIILLGSYDKISSLNMIIVITLFIFLTSLTNQFIIIHLIESIITPVINIPMIGLVAMMFITEYISMTNICDLERPIVDKCLYPFLSLDKKTNIDTIGGCDIVIRCIVLLLNFCYCIMFGMINIVWRIAFGKPLHRLR